MVKKQEEIQKVPTLSDISGIGPGTEEKLKAGGIYNLIGLATRTPAQLSEVAGVTESAARKMINAARDMCKLGFEMAKDIETKESGQVKIPTYCENIDKLIGGGLELGSSMEAFGQFSSGKTNLSHLFAVSTLKNFPDSYVIWIDSENTFKSSRIRDFCKGLEVDPEYALSHIKVAKAVNSDHQILLTESVEKEIVNNKLDVKLVIIDSLMNHFRAEYLGRGTLAGRQQMLNGYLHKIGVMCSNYNFAVYMTNQVQSDPGAMFGDPTKAVGGNIVAHFATIRVYMRPGQKGSRKMILKDSPNLPEGEASFMITETKLENFDGKE